MENVVTELAKYMILLLTAIYTYLGFAVLRGKNSQQRKQWIYRGQNFLILLIHFVGFLVLYLQRQETRLIWLYLSQLAVLAVSGILYRRLYRGFSSVLFLHMQFFLMTGFVFLTRLSWDQSVKQTVFVGAALCICLIVPWILEKCVFFDRMGIIYALLGIVLLLWVKVAGKEVYGATNWIRVNGVSFQPSEFVKLCFVFMTAAFLAKRHDFKQVVIVSALAAAQVLLLVLENDLGGALIFYVTYVLMLVMATRSWWYLAAGGCGGVLAAVGAYFAFAHVRVRVLAWQDPWSYIDNQGYQVAQSLFGIGTGGWFGMGLGKGLPNNIPVVTSDFIFAGLSEELGGFYAICLILIFLCSFFLILNMAWKTKNKFHQLITAGFCIMYAFQVFLSVGGVVKLIPSTGVTLPFISYGGSSVVSMILMFAIVQGMYVVGNGKGKRAARVERHPRQAAAVTYGFLTMFACLLLYIGYFIGIESREVINNSYNKRQELFANEVLRGEIRAADGTVLAYSREAEDGTVERVYPYADIYSHFVGRNSNGKTGVEALMNFELLTSNDNPLKKLSEKLNGELNRGDTAVATVRPALQTAADKALSGYQGAVVVLEPSTGKILALVSKPDYNPNTASDDWESLTSELESESRLLNRAANGVYPPGSTFKVLTALAYLREHPDGADKTYTCTGTFRNGDYQINCYNKTAHGTVGLERAFAVSCNGYFASVGLTLDRAAFAAMADELLFNTTLPADFPHRASSFVLTEESGEDEVMQTMIGQGKTQMTPLHNAMLAAAVANGGVLMKPYAVDRVETWDGNLVEKFWPESYGSLMEAGEAEVLKGFMEEVVIHGTATRLTGYPFEVYGKTGTAEYVEEGGGKGSHSWFMGFTDWDGESIALAVIVEGKNRGSRQATDVAAEVLWAWRNDAGK